MYGFMAGIEPISGAQLIARFRGGDREAFTALYRAHYPAVYRYAWHMTNDQTIALETTQDVFVWLIQHPAAFDPRRGELPAFLAGVARKMLQARARQGRRFAPLDEAALPAVPDATGDFARRQDVLQLRRAIQSLPEAYREPVVLCDLEGLSYDEAAAVLGCPTGTVRSRLHRARALLAKKLQPKSEKCSV
jgi:RNA polymerase sigma factor (sigma-70 family)